MESQLQCPVCTLFLHVGMDLQTHLDTHPKDQVIKALVNITLTKSNDPNTTSNDVHGKYAITDNAFAQEVNQFLPETIPRRPQQVLFGYSCSTRVFREVPNQQSTTTQKIITNALPSSHIVPAIPAQASFSNQPSRKFPPPPPPYGSVVSKMTIDQPVQSLSSTNSYSLQSRQAGLSNYRNGTLYLPVQNVVNEVETVSEENVDDYTNQTDQNSEYIEHCDEEYLEEDGENTNSMSMDISTQNECPSYENAFTKEQSQQDNRMIRPNSVIYINDDEPLDGKHDSQNHKKCTEGLRVLSDVKLPVSVDILNLDCKFGDSFKLDDVLRTRLQTDSGPVDDDDTENDAGRLVVGDGDDEFEIIYPAEDKESFDMVVKCEIEPVKVELGGEQQSYQNTTEVCYSNYFYSHIKVVLFLFGDGPLMTSR